MTIVVECAHCGRRSGAKEEWIGKSVKCPGCGQKTVVGGSAPTAGLSQPPPQQSSPPRAAKPAAPVGQPPLQARPASRGSQQPPAARPAGRPAGQPQAARRAHPARPAGSSPPAAARPVQPGTPAQAAMPAQPAMQPLGGDMLDLLGGDFGGAGASLPPMPAGAAGSPLGLPPARRRKKGSNKNLFIVLTLGVGVTMFLLCGGIAFVIVPPAIKAARRAAAQSSRPRNNMFSSASSTPVVTGPAWAPDASLAGQLTMPVNFDRATMKLPPGFSPAVAPTPRPPPGATFHNWTWASAPQPNGTRSVVVAGILQHNRAPRSSPNDLEQALTGAMGGMRRTAGMAGFQHSPGERGQLSGKPFIRARFSGMANGVKMHGIFLLTIEGARLVSLCGMSPEAPETQNYKLLEAALLTYQER